MILSPSRKGRKAVRSKSRTTRIPFLTKTRKLLAVMIFLSPSRKGRKGCAQQITDNVYSFLTKTIKTLAAMQGLRPLFLSGTVVLRSKLRPAGTRKKQPSFLRLASRQGKPGKQLTPRGFTQPTQSPDGAVSGREYYINAEGPKPYTPVPTKG